jgi:hypothetical protein
MQGLRLREASGRQPSMGVDGCGAPHAGSARNPTAAPSSMQGSAPQAACACQDAQSPAHLRAANTLPAGAPDCSPVSFDSVWSTNGAGATATALLRKLRWLTVGPRYDWSGRCSSLARARSSAQTRCFCLSASFPIKICECQACRLRATYPYHRRLYDFKGPYHALPAYAAALARGLVTATEQAVQSAAQQQPRKTLTDAVDSTPSGDAPAEAAQGHATGVGHEPVCTCQPADLLSSGTLITEQQQLLAGSPTRPAPQAHQHAASLQHNGAARGGQRPVAPAQPCQGLRPPLPRPQTAPHDVAQAFSPDAALVCFYRAGDTLCGHRDDVEHDLSQVLPS